MAEKSFSTHVNQIYLPGDSVALSKTDEISSAKIVIGPGIRKYGKQILVTKPGVLRTKASPATYWIDCHHKRYVPARGDDVIGVVTNKVGESYKVNIGSSEEASLSSIAFPGATKKNKPNIQIGDLVFAKLLIASIDMEPELVCVNSLGENVGLGVLSTSGFLFTVPLHHIRKLLNPECTLLKSLGKALSFEIAVGMNGKIWIKAKSVKQTIALARAISISEHMNKEEMNKLCRKFVDRQAGF
uniref:Exosome complex component RRP40 n=1 Tax=Daphnia galeata TaxID=27404 RepID=A0A8J2WVX9_9CRUS|nr:unnamed protein product [Daphnia galeata]